MLPGARILAGLVLLLLGRRLYWVFVAGIGFLTGLELAPRLLRDQPEWVALAVALGLALLGTVLAIVAQKFIVALVGFLAGGGTGVLLLRTLGADGGVVTWLVYLVSGVVGIVLVLALFEWGLILLSSVAGANLIVGGIGESIRFSRQSALVIVAVVAVIGIIAQTIWRRPLARAR